MSLSVQRKSFDYTELSENAIDQEFLDGLRGLMADQHEAMTDVANDLKKIAAQLEELEYDYSSAP